MRFVLGFCFALTIGAGIAFADPLAPPPDLGPDTTRAYEAGRLIFNGHWRPSGTEGPDDLVGLGPLYNRIACSSCHSAGGRGKPPDGPDQAFLSALVRIGVVDQDGVYAPHPLFGAQIQDRAVPGEKPEAKLSLKWIETAGKYADGSAFSLRKPALTIAPDPGPDARWSIRIAPALHGVGVFPYLASNREGDGVFGWKAIEPSTAAQNASAFAEDMGLTSRYRPDPICPKGQKDCGGGPDEVGGIRLMHLTQFIDLLPAPKPLGGAEPRGEFLFSEIGCAACHVPELAMEDGPSTVRLFSDLDLHPMGKGLDDGLPENGVASDTWRTPPLWGLGAALKEDPALPMLHDGRARGVAEAILWHDGAARAAKEAFKTLPAEDRAALIAYLGTL